MSFLKSFVGLSVVAVIGITGASAQTAAALRESYSTLRNELEHSVFSKPLRLVSSSSSNQVQGDVDAVIDHPFDVVRSQLSTVKNWCDIMILHPNVTGCERGQKGLTVQLGPGGAPARFDFKVASSEADYLNLRLSAPRGPLGTKDFHIALEAAPLEGERTFVRLVFSHAYGLQAQLAMRAYMSTLGKDKVGFTVVGKTPEGKPMHVGDLRGALERHAMRYYLAIEAYLDTVSLPPAQRFEKRLQTWYANAERYPLQLHEEPEYLDLKRKIAHATS